jgi:hypothetical protein
MESKGKANFKNTYENNNEMIKIPNSNQSRNSSRNYKSDKQMGQHGPPEILEVGSGAQEE